MVTTDNTSPDDAGPSSLTAHDITEAERLLRARHYADVLRSNPKLVRDAVMRIAPIVETDEATLGQHLWYALLGEPLEVIIRCMTADNAEGRLLRSNNPFSILIGQAVITERRRTRREAHGTR